jgi:hypothetical protein
VERAMNITAAVVACLSVGTSVWLFFAEQLPMRLRVLFGLLALIVALLAIARL